MGHRAPEMSQFLSRKSVYTAGSILPVIRAELTGRAVLEKPTIFT